MYKISEESANKVLQYLAQKPYIETYQLIPLLQNLQSVKGEDVKQVETKETKKENVKNN